MHLPTVLLHHALPDGSAHVDWLVATDPGGTAPLRSWRLPRPLTELAAGESLPAERLADHRPHYLGYEGPISAGRGRVRRLARGEVIERQSADGGEIMTIRWQQSAEPLSFVQIVRLAPASDPADDSHELIICISRNPPAGR